MGKASSLAGGASNEAPWVDWFVPLHSSEATTGEGTNTNRGIEDRLEECFHRSKNLCFSNGFHASHPSKTGLVDDPKIHCSSGISQISTNAKPLVSPAQTFLSRKRTQVTVGFSSLRMPLLEKLGTINFKGETQRKDKQLHLAGAYLNWRTTCLCRAFTTFAMTNPEFETLLGVWSQQEWNIVFVKLNAHC